MIRVRALLVPLGLTFAVACGDDGTGPDPMQAVAGTYHATQIDVTFTGSDPLDAIALGASIDVVLSPEGTTTGTAVIPAILTDDGLHDEVIDMAGTFTVAGNTLTFHPTVDSFFGEPAWVIGNGTLTAVDSQPEGTFEVTLTRS